MGNGRNRRAANRNRRDKQGVGNGPCKPGNFRSVYLRILAHAAKPDLIVLDMMLPKLSGPEVLARLKQDAATAKIPVVVLSSLTEKNRKKLIDAGAEEYLEKNSLCPEPGVNLLPKILENVICRVHRKHGMAFNDTPIAGR